MKAWKHSRWKHRVFPLSQLSASVGNNPPNGPDTAGGVCLTCGQISQIILQTWPLLSSPSRRFNRTRWFMPTAVIKFRAKAQPAVGRFLYVPWAPNSIVSSFLSIYHMPFGQIRTWAQKSRCLPLDKVQNNSLVEEKGRIFDSHLCVQRNHFWYMTYIKIMTNAWFSFILAARADSFLSVSVGEGVEEEKNILLVLLLEIQWPSHPHVEWLQDLPNNTCALVLYGSRAPQVFTKRGIGLTYSQS